MSENLKEAGMQVKERRRDVMLLGLWLLVAVHYMAPVTECDLSDLANVRVYNPEHKI